MAHTNHIRSYNAFLRATKSKHGITHKVAQQLYREVKRELGRNPKGVDATRHPRIVSRNITNAKRQSTIREKKRVEEKARQAREEKRIATAEAKARKVEDGDEWEEWAITFEY